LKELGKVLEKLRNIEPDRANQ